MVLLLMSVLAASCHLALGQELRVEGVVDLRQVTHETGHCTIVPLPTRAGPPDNGFGSVSSLRLFEDQRELGPAHSLHQLIRDEGRGRFSHWSGSETGEPQGLYFSASDNSDPTRNGRVYRWVVSLDPARMRQALHLGLVHGGLLSPPREPVWYVAVRLDSSFPPFTALKPRVELAMLDARGGDARGASFGGKRAVEVTPRQWVAVGPVSELARQATAVRATMPLSDAPEGGTPPMVEVKLPGDGPRALEVTGRDWHFQAQGPWLDLPDPRGLRAMRYPWHVSATGEVAELSRQVTVPADWRPPFTLTFFCSDDYSDDGERPEKPANSVDAYPGHRFKQVLVDGTVAWERDIADPSGPSTPTDFAVDLSRLVQPGRTFTLVLRNLDKVGLATRLPTDFYLRGIYEGDRPEGNYVLATTCWWGDVSLWQGSLTEGPAWPRPESAAVRDHLAAHALPSFAGEGVALPASLGLEGADSALLASTPAVCGLPLPPGAARDLGDLSLRLGDRPLDAAVFLSRADFERICPYFESWVCAILWGDSRPRER